MRWFSKSNRTLESKDVQQFVEHRVDIHVFVKKDDAEGSDHYYLEGEGGRGRGDTDGRRTACRLSR